MCSISYNNNSNNNKLDNMREIESITFKFNISFLTSLRRSPPPLSSAHQN